MTWAKGVLRLKFSLLMVGHRFYWLNLAYTPFEKKKAYRSRFGRSYTLPFFREGAIIFDREGPGPRLGENIIEFTVVIILRGW